MSTLNKNRFQGGVPTFVPSLSSCRPKRGQDPGNEVEYMLNRFAIERRNAKTITRDHEMFKFYFLQHILHFLHFLSNFYFTLNVVY